MADGGRQDVLGLKARAAQRAHEARGMSTAKALRRALARTAEDLWALPVVCDGVQLELLDQDGVAESLGDGRLILLLDGPDGAVGLAQADRAVLAAMTEIQTIQTVTALPVEDRPLTSTDAAMMAPLLDGTLTRLAANLDGNPLRPQLAGYRFGAMLEDRRSAALLLDAAEYRTFHVELDIAGGRRVGSLSIFLPDRDIAARDDDAPTEPEARHEAAMLEVTATLRCILSRVRMPLSDLETLQPGDLLRLPATALDGVELISGDGKAIAGGRLGQLNGARAVRLRWPRGDGAGGAHEADGTDDDEDAGALSDGPAAAAMPALAGLPDLQEADAGDADPDDALPDLPPLDFDGMGDFDFAAAAADFDTDA